MKLETERLFIRAINMDDKEDIYMYRSDKLTNKFQVWIPTTIEDLEIFIAKISKQMNVAGTWFQFVIIEKEKQLIIGDLGIHFINTDNKEVEIGFTLAKEYQNKGYAIEAVKKVIDYIFHNLNKHRIIASVDPANTSSIKLLEKLGFRKEAHFVESLLINGSWVDDVIYALLKKENLT